MVVLESKDAEWDKTLNSYVLNYHGRASQVIMMIMMIFRNIFKIMMIVYILKMMFDESDENNAIAIYKSVKLNISWW